MDSSVVAGFYNLDFEILGTVLSYATLFNIGFKFLWGMYFDKFGWLVFILTLNILVLIV